MQILRPALSATLALTLVALPTNSALAQQPAGGAADAQPAGADPNAETDPAAEGEGAEGEGAEGAEGEGAEGEGAEGEGAEGEEGEGEEGEGEEGEGEEGEGDGAIAVTGPEGPVDDDTPTEPKIGKWPAKGTGMLISGGVLLGLGTAGLITSILLTNCPEPANSIGCKNQHNRDFLVPISASVITVGIVLLAVGGANAAKYKRWRESSGPKQALVPTFNRQSAGLAYTLKF